MSRQVDNKVVEMTFDNARFEKNVKESMESIKKLDEELKILENASYLTNLDKSVKNFSLDSIATSIENLNNRFSTMGIIGMTAISNITNTAINAGKKIASSIVEPIKSGGLNRALNIEQAKFQFKGLGMDIEKTMEDASYAVDGTAYSLDAAAKVASQLGASGMKAGDQMKTALRGVSGVAAMTNSSYEDIGRIFTTVAGQGRLMGDQLNQLSARGINAAATLGKYLGKSEAEVRAMTSKGQISFQMFAAAMDSAFGEHAKDANQTFTGAMSNMKAALSRIGEDFMTPYINNMKDVYNAVRPWLNNLRTALKPIAKDAENIMIGMNKRIVKALGDDNWVDVQTNGVEIFRNSLRALLTILTPIARAWKEVFPGSAIKNLKDFTERVKNFTESLGLNSRSMANLRDTFKGLFTILRLLGNVFTTLLHAIFPFTQGAGELIDVVLMLTGFLGRLVTTGVNVFNEFGGVAKVFSIIKDSLFSLIGIIGYGIVSFYEFASKTKLVQYAMHGVEIAIGAIVTGISLLINYIERLWNTDPRQFFNNLKTDFKKFGNSLKDLKIVKSIMSMFSKSLKMFGIDVSVLCNKFSPLIDLFKNFKKTLSESFNLEGPIGFFKSVINFIKDIINLSKDLSKSGNLFESFIIPGSFLDTVNYIFKTFLNLVKNFVSELTPGKLAAFAFSAAVVSMAFAISKAVKSFTGVGHSIRGFFNTLTSSIKGVKKPKSILRQFAESIAILTASLTVLTMLDSKKLNNATKAIGLLVAELAGIGILFTILGKFKSSKNFSLASKAIEALSFSVLILTASLVTMNKVDMNGIGKKMLVLMGVMASLATVATLMGKFAPKLTKGSIFMLAFSFATSNVIKALAKLEDVNLEKMGEKIAGLFVIMSGLAILAKGVGTIRLTSVAGLFALVAVLNYALPTIQTILNSVNVGKVIQAVEDYIILITAVSALGLLIGKAFEKIGNGVKSFGIGLIALSGAILLLTQVAKLIDKANLSTSGFTKAGIFISGALVLFALIIKSTHFQDAGKYAVKLGLMAVGISTAVLLLSLAAKSFAKLDSNSWLKGIAAVDSMLALFMGIIIATQYAKDVNTKVILGAILGIVVLMGELIVMTLIPWNDLLVAAGTMAIVLLSFSKSLELVSSKKFNADNIMGMVAMAVIIGEFAIILDSLAQYDWKSLLSATVSLGITMLAFANIISTISSKRGLGTGKWDKIAQVVGVAVAMIPMAVSLSILSKYNWKSILSSAIGMSLALGAVGLVLKVLSNMKSTGGLAAGASIILVATGMIILGKALKTFVGIDWGTLGKAGAAILGIAVVLGVLGAIAGNAWPVALGMLIVAEAFNIFGKAVLKAGAGIALAGLGLNIMIPALEALNKLDLASIGNGMLVLAPGLMMIGLAGIPMLIGAAGIAAGALALGLLGPVLEPLENIDLANIGKQLISLAGGASVMGLAGTVLALGTPGIIAAGLGLVKFAAGILMISDINLDTIGIGLMSIAKSGLVLGAAGLVLIAGGTGFVIASAGLIVLAEALEKFGSIFEEVVPKIEEKYLELVNTISIGSSQAGYDAVLGLITPITSNLGIIKDVGKSMAFSLLNGISIGGGWHSPWVMTIKAGKDAALGIIQGSEEKADDIKTTWENISEECIVNVVERSMEKVNKILNTVSTGLANTMKNAEKGMSFFDKAAQKVEDTVGGLIPDFKDLTDWTEEFAKAGEDVFDVESMLDDVTNSLDESFSSLGDTFGSVSGSAKKTETALSKLTDNISSQLDIFSKFDMKVEMTGEQMLENMRSQIQGVTQWANNLQILAERGVNKGLLEKLSELGPQGYEKVAAFVQMTDEQLIEAGSLFEQSLTLPKSAAQQILTSFANSGKNAALGYINGLTAEASQVADASADVAQQSLDSWNSTLGINSPSRETYTSAMYTCLGYIRGLIVYEHPVITQVEILCHRIISTFYDELHESKFYTLGSNIVQGLSHGMTDNIDLVISAAASVANAALESAHIALDVNSPSKKFWSLGKSSDEGLAKGFINNQSMVTNAVDTVGNNMVNRFNGIVKTVSLLFDREMDADPVIKPTLDLTNVANGLDYINNMFESQRLNVRGHVGVEENDAIGGNSYVFNQYNTSPKALNRIEIYRQTNNQISRFKREVEAKK